MRVQKTIDELKKQEFLNPSELAQLLGVSLSTVNRITRSGEIACHRFGARNIRYSQQQIADYLQASKVNEPLKELLEDMGINDDNEGDKEGVN